MLKALNLYNDIHRFAVDSPLSFVLTLNGLLCSYMTSSVFTEQERMKEAARYIYKSYFETGNSLGDLDSAIFTCTTPAQRDAIKEAIEDESRALLPTLFDDILKGIAPELAHPFKKWQKMVEKKVAKKEKKLREKADKEEKAEKEKKAKEEGNDLLRASSKKKL